MTDHRAILNRLMAMGDAVSGDDRVFIDKLAHDRSCFVRDTWTPTRLQGARLASIAQRVIGKRGAA